MVTTTKMDSVLIQGKEKLQQARDSGKSAITLYEALEIFSLGKFKDLLTESGWIDMLKQRSNITVIAPINEAFGRINPLVAAELSSAKGLERAQTLARAHIIPKAKLVGTPVSELGFESTYDLNGDVVDLRLEVRRDAGSTGNANSKTCILHSINNTRPLEPWPPDGSVRLSNGRLILVSDVMVSKSFLEQKYFDVYRKFFDGGEDSKKFTLWECFTKLGLTRFCKAVEDAGLVELLQQPHDKATKPFVVAPVDEALNDIPKRFIEWFESSAGRENFVKRQIFSQQEYIERVGDLAAPLFSPAPKFKASNGNFVLTATTSMKKAVGWNSTFAPLDID